MLGFRKWIELENKKTDMLQATEDESFPERVYSYLSVALGIPIKKLEKQDWQSTVLSLIDVHKRFSPDASLPILRHTQHKEATPVDWDYPQRTWAFYSHLLAKAYGWTLEYIAEMDVNDALSRLQEIMTDEQLDREFVYGLSEIAYPYNKNTKKSEFKPMKRPYWMLPTAPTTIKKIKIKRSMLPQGRIIDASGLPPQFDIEGLEVERPHRK